MAENSTSDEPAAPASVPKNVQGFAPEYVEGLKEQIAADRKRAEEAERRAAALAEEMKRKEADAAEKIAAAEKVAAARIAEMESKAREKMVAEALKAAAQRAGMIDLDGLRLLDTNHVTVDEAGNVVGADALMEDAKASKAWLFRAQGSASAQTPPPATTSAPASPPAAPPSAPKPKSAKDMTPEEFRAARKAIREGRLVVQ